MKFASLGSGSEGNALLISSRSGTTQTTIMLDCGFTVKEAERRMARLGVAPAELAGIIVTHEHHDHINGVFKLARRYRVPVWLSYGTYQAVIGRCDDVSLHLCRDGNRVAIGDLEISPYTVPHDAREPIQFTASDGRSKLGILTDAGHCTPRMADALAACDALLLECNHDAQMLADSSYPPSLKRRVGGDYGHLSNQAASQMLGKVDKSRLRRVIGAHLSLKNNTPALARAALAGVVGAEIHVSLACQQNGFNWMEAA